MPAKPRSQSSVFGTSPGILVFLLVLMFTSGVGVHLLISTIFAEQSVAEGVLQACVKRNGEMRLLVPNKRDDKERRVERDSCRGEETLVRWNIQGVPGAPGPSGSSLPLICPSCDIGDSVGDRLKGRDLSNAVLTNANLSGANLEGVNFTNANLSGADVNGANLSGVEWNNTICPDGSNSNDHNDSCLMP